MPEAVSSTVPNAPNVNVVSNALEDMITPGVGPEQADCRVNICEYVSFDYAGQFKDDPVVAVHMNLSPLGGENEGKDFDIEWTTGGKMSEFAIINDGGSLAVTAAKASLANNSNWALCLRSMADAAFESKLLNGPRGIRAMEGMEWTIRRIGQPKREGLDDKTTKGRDKMYYTCLKIDVMPGETGKKVRRAPAQRSAPSAGPASPPAQARAQAPAAASNGTGDDTLIGYINGILAASPSIAIKDLGRAVFIRAKEAGNASETCMSLGTRSMSDDFLFPAAMERGWKIDNGVLTAA